MVKKLPSSLRHLILGKNVATKKNTPFKIYSTLLPDGLESLVINCSVKFAEKCLPNSLKKITIREKNKYLLSNIKFSNNIKCITN